MELYEIFKLPKQSTFQFAITIKMPKQIIKLGSIETSYTIENIGINKKYKTIF
jgi:hypothetical protein